jgi:predicted ATPase
VSDGLVRLLASLAVIYDPRTSILALEEPENAMHPWAIRVIIDACKESMQLTADRHIVVSSHSPVMIDYVSPNQLLMIWRDREASRSAYITELDPDLYQMWESGEVSVFEILDSGLIEEAVP